MTTNTDDAQHEVLFLSYAEQIRSLETEHVLVLFLDERIELIAQKKMTQDHVFKTEFCARNIFAPALVHQAKHIVLIHNHPSGSVTPSPTDYITTVMLAQAGALLQVTVIDHLIVTKSAHFSFRKEGIL